MRPPARAFIAPEGSSRAEVAGIILSHRSCLDLQRDALEPGVVRRYYVGTQAVRGVIGECNRFVLG